MKSILRSWLTFCGILVNTVSCTREIMYAYICRFAQRRINELYRDIRQKHTVGITISFTDSKILNKNQRQRAIKISNNKAELRRKENCRQLR